MDQIEEDVKLMVGGEFSPVAITPEAYNAILARARSQVNEYLDAFERLFLGVRFDAQMHSRLHFPWFLSLLKDAAPDRVRELANHLIKQYDAVLVIYDHMPDKKMLDDTLPVEAANYLVRLNDRREQLKNLIAQL
jgi:hypothetical protein